MATTQVAEAEKESAQTYDRQEQGQHLKMAGSRRDVPKHNQEYTAERTWHVEERDTIKIVTQMRNSKNNVHLKRCLYICHIVIQITHIFK